MLRLTVTSPRRPGPRGGGRYSDATVDHVLKAESAYARKLGLRLPQPAPDDAATVAELRTAIADVLRHESDGALPLPKG